MHCSILINMSAQMTTAGATIPSLQTEVAKPDTKSMEDTILRSSVINTDHDNARAPAIAGPTDKTHTTMATTTATTTAAAVTQQAFEILQLSEEEARAEEERAAEKIRQRTRPLNKFNTIRRNIGQALHHDEPGSGLEPSESVNLQPQTVVPEVYPEEPSSSSPIPQSPGSHVNQTPAEQQQHPTTVEEEATSHKDSKLINIEPPRLVDAQTVPGDKRYFQGPNDPAPEGDFVYDFLYQHQRGAFFLGTPNFSSKSLLPVDPDEWTNSNFETSAMDISDFEVPDPSWEWVHKSWLVDMTGDVDEDGWEYAMTFHGSPWHGNYEIFRSFARRRRWLRLRKRKVRAFS
jgi:hypothetical protein